ncbi:hypothetical protein FOL47_008970 [Perkinsus chesapeaki]|uniref:Uncharacterized protein n=1 Tax=Perkinsus chesapeaki TaxID=330153 RepID=A0A7J6N2L7_PERCH|nr:hypothetical protein FOL47_008970 [Perkinsus chesapeaki]
MSASLPQQTAGGCSTVGLLHRVYTLGAYPAFSKGVPEFDDNHLEMRNSFGHPSSSRSSSAVSLRAHVAVYPPYRRDDIATYGGRKKHSSTFNRAEITINPRDPPLWFSRGRASNTDKDWRPTVSTGRYWRHSNARHWYQGASSSYFNDSRSSVPQRRGKLGNSAGMALFEAGLAADLRQPF